jgi:hypothetical protein
MMEKIVHTAKHTVKVTVVTARVLFCLDLGTSSTEIMDHHHSFVAQIQVQDAA